MNQPDKQNETAQTPETDTGRLWDIAAKLARDDMDTSADYLRNVATRLAAEKQRADDAERERDRWKASHDNQVNLRRALMDRPDLKERARLVRDLACELTAAHEQVAQLREALEKAKADSERLDKYAKLVETESVDVPGFQAGKWFIVRLDPDGAFQYPFQSFRAAIDSALTQPAKPTP